MEAAGENSADEFVPCDDDEHSTLSCVDSWWAVFGAASGSSHKGVRSPFRDGELGFEYDSNGGEQVIKEDTGESGPESLVDREDNRRGTVVLRISSKDLGVWDFNETCRVPVGGEMHGLKRRLAGDTGVRKAGSSSGSASDDSIVSQDSVHSSFEHVGNRWGPALWLSLPAWVPGFPGFFHVTCGLPLVAWGLQLKISSSKGVMVQNVVDVVVVGAGPSGLACSLLLAQHGLAVCLIDPRLQEEWRPTISMFLDELKNVDWFQELMQEEDPTIHKFHITSVLFDSPDPSNLSRKLSFDRSYCIIDKSRVRARMLSACRSNDKFREIKEAVCRVVSGPENVEVQTSAGSIGCSWLVDASGHSSFLTCYRREAARYYQYFHAEEVHLSRAHHLPMHEMILMDWTRPFDHSCSTSTAQPRTMDEGSAFGEPRTFLYLFPTSPTTVFAEETVVCSTQRVSKAYLKKTLRQRLGSEYGWRNDNIPARHAESAEEAPAILSSRVVESGCFPMGGAFPNPCRSRVTAIGAAGRYVNPSTGYSVAMTWHVLPTIVNAIVAELQCGLLHGATSRVLSSYWSVGQRLRYTSLMVGARMLSELSFSKDVCLSKYMSLFFSLPQESWSAILSQSLPLSTVTVALIRLAALLCLRSPKHFLLLASSVKQTAYWHLQDCFSPPVSACSSCIRNNFFWSSKGLQTVPSAITRTAAYQQTVDPEAVMAHVLKYTESDDRVALLILLRAFCCYFLLLFACVSFVAPTVAASFARGFERFALLGGSLTWLLIFSGVISWVVLRAALTVHFTAILHDCIHSSFFSNASDNLLVIVLCVHLANAYDRVELEYILFLQFVSLDNGLIDFSPMILDRNTIKAGNFTFDIHSSGSSTSHTGGGCLPDGFSKRPSPTPCGSIVGTLTSSWIGGTRSIRVIHKLL